MDGDHNSPRPGFLFDSVYIFLQNYLRVPLEWGLDRENTVMGLPPWHYAAGGRSRDVAAAAALFGAAAAARGDESGGFDPDFTDFDWDGVGLDDIGVDGNPSVGMTRARQAQFQTALFHVLAQVRVARTACCIRATMHVLCAVSYGWEGSDFFCHLISAVVRSRPALKASRTRPSSSYNTFLLFTF